MARREETREVLSTDPYDTTQNSKTCLSRAGNLAFKKKRLGGTWATPFLRREADKCAEIEDDDFIAISESSKLFERRLILTLVLTHLEEVFHRVEFEELTH